MITGYLKAGAIVLFGITLFSAGYDYASYRYRDNEQKATIQALNDNAKKQEEMFSEVIHVQNNFDVSNATVSDRYQSFLDDDMFTDDRRLSVSTTNDTESMPDHSANSSTSSGEKECRCNDTDKRELQRVRILYEKELSNSKRCDEAIIQLNSLIDLYHAIK